MESDKKYQYYDNYLSALLEGKWSICNDLINKYLEEDNNVIELYEDVVKKAMYEVGSLWEHNKISVASEHLASSITESIINKLLYDIEPIQKTEKNVILACVENEQHQIGLKMLADIFERYGWNTMILGANTPGIELIRIANNIKPDLIALSLTMFFNLPILEKMLKEIKRELSMIPILVGGQAFTRGGFEVFINFENVKYFPNLYSIEEFLKLEGMHNEH